MAEPQRAPQQHKQPSRKGKKAWRKNVDIAQVQLGLDDVREQITQGGVLTERPSDELFALDTTGSAAIKDDFANKHKQLKAEEILAQRSAVPAVASRKRKTADGVVQASSKRSKNGTYVSHRDLQRLRSLASSADAAADIISSEPATHDAWAAVEPPPFNPETSFLRETRQPRQPSTLHRAPISLAANGKPFAAVKTPVAGKSYNPAFEDWETFVARQGEKEVEAETLRLRQAKEYDDRMEKALAEAAKPDPKSDDEDESAWESEWEGIQSEPEESYLDRKMPERKSQAERNKIKRRKAAEAQEKWQKQMRKREEQQNRIKEIGKLVEKRERERMATLDVQSDDSDQDEVLRRRKLGRIPVPSAPLEVVLADELQDSLRALRPEGNLLKDRFRNLLLNGKIESRRPITQPKKPKRVATEKWTYKDWKLR